HLDHRALHSFPTRRSSDLRDRTFPSTRGSCSLMSRRESSRHPDRLDVDELLEPILRQLAPVPRELDAAERQPGVGLHEPVDENRDRKSTRLNSSHLVISYA